MSGPLVVVGDALLDRDIAGAVNRLAPDAPAPVLEESSTITRPGGAALAAVLAAREHDEVLLVTAFAKDAAGSELLQLLAEYGVEVLRLPVDGATPEKIRLCCAGRPLFRLDRHAGPVTVGPLPREASAALAGASAVLVADYGRGVSGKSEIRSLVAASPVPVVWDPHPRGGPPVLGVLLATPNLDELPGGRPASDLRSRTDAAATARRDWAVAGLALTLGAEGALYLSGDGPPLLVPAPPVRALDTCGAGDCFSATAALALARGALPSEAVAEAVGAASRFVGEGGSGGLGARALREPPGSWAAPLSRTTDAGELARRVHAQGGIVVTTGGCFDLLHAGHLASLRAARGLGDRLVVCLNSDASVTALKGPGRPVVAAEDRAAVLAALDCVDAVVVFDELTPNTVLRRIQPDIFAKGGDYGNARLPEQDVLDGWGGQCVTLPYRDGYSTSSLVAQVRGR